jgi:hypothetical protein
MTSANDQSRSMAAATQETPKAASRRRFWTAAFAVLSAVNLGAVWFAARPGEPWHATTHAALAVGFGLWAQSRMRREAGSRTGRQDQVNEVEIAALGDEVGDVRRELGEVQERLDFAERMLTQTREADRLRGRGEP